ncbi:MAG: hypothetical protein HFG75_01610 [Hungatella sp.]|nr:hypothetical protein [Hungatella sp.]
MTNTTVNWTGEDGKKWKAELGIVDRMPCILSLNYELGGKSFTLGSMLKPQFRVITAKRTKKNPQRMKDLAPGEVLGYQWDTYSDDPMRAREQVKQADAQWNTTKLTVTTDGNRTTVSFDGLTLGQFLGRVDFNFFDGSNLIRMEAVASTEEDGVAYLYHAGLQGFQIDKIHYVTPKQKEVYEYPGYQVHSGPERDRVRVKARNRLVTLRQENGSIAIFPSPHRFFWGAQSENIVGYHYYVRGYDGTMAIGIRNNKEEEYHNVRWPCYNAKPGTIQKMSVFFLPSAASVWETRAMVLRYTNFDRFRKLQGYQRLIAHIHIAAGSAWVRDIRVQRPWEKYARGMDADIIVPCEFWGESMVAEKDNREPRIREQERYHAMARYCSSEDFLVVPGEELCDPTNKHTLIRYHVMVIPSKPLLYSRWREDDQEFVETLPDGRLYYHLKSAEDFIEMCRRENAFILMPHPDTKANDGLPYSCREEAWFKDERWFGIGTRQLPADNSVSTMISGRTERVWNDINNWSDRPRYMISEIDTYSKVEEDEEDWDTFAQANCTYVQLDHIPGPDGWGELVDSLRAGHHFYCTGEILLHESAYSDKSADCTFSWTFPLDYVELVYSDGEHVTSIKKSMTQSAPYGHESFHFDFPEGMKWARVAAVDIAGNSCFGMPVFLKKESGE